MDPEEAAESLSAEGKRDLIYQLAPDAKRLKKNDPRDLTAIEAAAKKEAKQKETQFTKALGTSPKDQIRDEKSLTGLRETVGIGIQTHTDVVRVGALRLQVPHSALSCWSVQ